MYQSVTIAGNLGRDVELRYTKDGVAVANFSVAVNNYKDEVVWFRVAAWRETAEACSQYLQKGSKVLVVGTIEASAWTDKEGNARASLELTARTVKFLSGKQDELVKVPNGPVPVGDETEIPF